MSIVDKAKKVGVVVGAATAVYELAVKVEGKPLRARTEPATVRIFGVPLFERDANLDRYWFGGLIRRGKSKVAKRAIAEREGGNVK